MACGYFAAYWKLLKGIVMDITGDDNVELRSVAAKIKKSVSDQASVNMYNLCTSIIDHTCIYYINLNFLVFKNYIEKKCYLH